MKKLVCLALLVALPAGAQSNQLKLEEAVNKLQRIPAEAATFKIQLAMDAVEFCRTQTRTVERSNRFMTWFGTVAATNEFQFSQVTNGIAVVNRALKTRPFGPVGFIDHHRIVVANVDIVEVSLEEAKYKVRKGIGGGFVKLNLLPPQLQAALGYDIGTEFFVFREQRRKAEAELNAELQRVTQESDRAWRDYSAALSMKPQVLSAQTKFIEAIGEFSRLAYVVKIANRNDHLVLNDVKVNLLDAEGFILETDTDYGFETPPRTTNELRGIFLMKTSTANQMARTEATLKERKIEP